MSTHPWRELLFNVIKFNGMCATCPALIGKQAGLIGKKIKNIKQLKTFEL